MNKTTKQSQAEAREAIKNIKVADRKVSVKGILFDKDGTLLDFMSLWGGWAQSLSESIEQFLIQNNIMVPKVADMLGTVRNEHGFITDYDPRGPLAMASVEEMNSITAWQLYQMGFSWNDALQHARKFVQKATERIEEQRSIRQMPGLTSFLDKCRLNGLKLAVVTSDDTAAAIKHLEWMNIRQYFELIVGHDEVNCGKPDPEMVFYTCGKLGLPPSQTMVIGDSNGDMQMGKLAGAALVVGIASSQKARNALLDADEIIYHYDQLSFESR